VDSHIPPIEAEDKVLICFHSFVFGADWFAQFAAIQLSGEASALWAGK
jgi:hypothetical protein